VRHAAALTLTLLVAGCGAAGEGSDGRVRTTDAGTRVIGATDPKTWR
jgi:hypothetical protein